MRLSSTGLRQLKEEGDDVADALNTFFLLLSGYLVFFMQCGFCMVRPTHRMTREQGTVNTTAAPKGHANGCGNGFVARRDEDTATQLVCVCVALCWVCSRKERQKHHS